MNPKRLLIPFSSRNYRLFFAGQIVSLVGSWMTQTATVWLVYHFTQSAFWLGAVTFLGQIPIVLLAPLAGVCVDRFDRMKILKLTQAAAMLQSFALAALAISGHINIAWLTGLAIFQGVINAFDMPARQSLVIHLVEKREHLANVIGLNSSMFNIARIIGPGLAGFVISDFGAGYCFLIDGISYLAVLIALCFIQIRRHVRKEKIESVWSDFRSGLKYAAGFGPIRQLILTAACFTIFGISANVLIPVYAEKIFGGDAKLLGLLMSASAIGSLLAALYLATRKGLKGMGHLIVFGAVAFGLSLLAFAYSRNLHFSMFCLTIAGLGQILIMASNNTLIQNLVDEEKRGRVMSLYGMAFLGGMPIGSLITGGIADWLNPPIAVTLCGIATLIITYTFYRQLPKFRIEARAALKTKMDISSPVIE
jgi:MFS family permease